MAREHSQLEHLPDGFIAFHTDRGERWRHRDFEDSRVGPGYRLFVSDSGEQRRYDFGKNEPHDVTLFDLRDQLSRAKAFTPDDTTSAGTEAADTQTPSAPAASTGVGDTPIPHSTARATPPVN